MRRRSTLAVNFHIHRGKSKKGKHPIIMRISINGANTTMYTGRYISSKYWETGKCSIDADCPDSLEINNELDRLRNLVFYHHKRIISERGFITADMIKQAIRSEADPVTLLEVFKVHNAEYEKRIGKDRTLGCFDCYEVIYRSVENFIKVQYNLEDIKLKSLDIAFVNDYEFYLRVTKRLSSRTAWTRIMLLRKVVRLAISKGLLNRDPFFGYAPVRLKSNFDFLTEEEFHRILTLDINDPDICFARDMFVFSAFTGLSLCDIQSLEYEHISGSSDGELWIIKKRENTDMNSKIFLFDIPRRIIQKYSGRQNTDKVFDTPDRTTIGRYMRIISQMCGFDRRVIFRMARPCFAGLITLKHGIPVETVSRMMGYSSAESAGKFININRQKVADDMDALNEKMEGLYKLPHSAFCYMNNQKDVMKNVVEWSG